jgi:hypothetical protein
MTYHEQSLRGSKVTHQILKGNLKHAFWVYELFLLLGIFQVRAMLHAIKWLKNEKVMAVF